MGTKRLRSWLTFGVVEMKVDITIKPGVLDWEKAKIFEVNSFRGIHTEKVKEEIEILERFGYCKPLVVWKGNGVLWVLSGAHLLAALFELKARGTTLPSQVTCLFLICNSILAAVRYLEMYTKINLSMLLDVYFEGMDRELDQLNEMVIET